MYPLHDWAHALQISAAPQDLTSLLLLLGVTAAAILGVSLVRRAFGGPS